MKASNITRAINHLESCQEILDQEGFSERSVELQSLISDLRSAKQSEIEVLYTNAKHRRATISNLPGGRRLDFFKAWENDVKTEYYTRILSSYANWEFPALEIFPGSGGILPSVVSSEPLYIADWEDHVLQQASTQFNGYYSSKRLMQYKISGYDLSDLPQNSFGLIYCVNWLRFEDHQGLITLAKAAYDLLMPGGFYIFSYNPLEKHWAVELLEKAEACGANSDELELDLRSIGFEIADHHIEGVNNTHFKLKKPGEIERIKSGSVLGKIIDKPTEI